MARVTPKIPIATLDGGDHSAFSLSKDNWLQIEAAYGHVLSREVRKQICHATLQFLSSTEVEQVARPVAEARERIVRIKKAAIDLQKVLLDNPQDEGSDPRLYADRQINRCFNDNQIKDRKVIGFFVTGVGSLIVACNHALKHLEKNRGRQKGEAWDNWVCRISEIAKINRLPSEARKDDDANEKPSPFVALIRELQHFLPKEYPRSTHSNIALAVAITGARRVAKNSDTRSE
jgi:hypothetical protein